MGQEKVIVAKQPLAMKPVGKEKIAEVLETDDIATGAHKIAASDTKVKHKGKLEKKLDMLSTENEKGEQQLLDEKAAKKVLGHDHKKKKAAPRERSDSSSSSSSSSDDESKKRHHKKPTAT